jgi:hypothetical protein
MGDNDSKEFRGYLIFNIEPAEEPDKSQHYLAMQLTIVKENSNCFDMYLG